MTGTRHGGPYVGLRPYDTDDNSRFFGRTRESHEVASLWLGSRLLTLHGSSGVGKTSLICAGVLPIVRPEAEVLPIGRLSRGSTFSATALREHNPYTFAVLSSWSPDDAMLRLSGLSVYDFLAKRAFTDRYGDPVPILAAIDRFEDFFHDSPDRWRYREEFIQELSSAVREIPQLRLLLVIRDDSLAALLPYETVIAGHAKARFHLKPLTPESALDAVTRPLQGTSRYFAPGVAEQLIENLRTIQLTNSIGETTQVVTETLEPTHLQVLCSELWRRIPEDVREITAQHLSEHGDPDRTLVRFCDEAITQVADKYAIPVLTLGKWLEDTFVTELGTRGTVYEGLTTTGGVLNTVVRALEDRHILKCEQRSGSRWYELAHDRLIEPIRRMNRPWSIVTDGDASATSAADYLRAAETALADGELTLAEKHAEEALRHCGDGDDPRLEPETESFLAHLAEQRNRPEDAEHRYRRAAELFEALQDQTAVGRLLAQIGGVLLKRGLYASAVEELQAAVARLPGELAVQIGLARAFSCSGQAQAAAALYGSVLTVAPESTEALSGRGQVLADLGDGSPALADLRRLIALHPEYEVKPDIRSARGLALAGLGRSDEAAAEISAARRAAPDDGTVLLRAAKVARAAGDADAARDLARRALSAGAEPLFPHQADEARNLSRV